MKQRHRMPTIFSIYMVDVLCCALGCAILLWLVNYHDSRKRAAVVTQTGKQLVETQSALDAATTKLDSLTASLADAQKREQDTLAQLKKVQSEKDQIHEQILAVQKDLSDTKKSLEVSRKALVALEGERDKAGKLLALLEKQHADSKQALALSDKELANLRLAMRMLESEASKTTASLKAKTSESTVLSRQLAELRVQAKDFQARLGVADIRTRLLEEDLDKGKKFLSITQKQYQDLLLAHELLSKRLALSGKELSAANADVAALKRDKLSLTNKARLLEDLVEHRFAGITLTGQKVLFLVDMSGSMELLDEDTPDPDKWPLVCETVAKIMRSLPDLRQYQVILFSDKVRYAFGNAGRWLKYEGPASANNTFLGLKAIKPAGETNMAAVFEEAFRFRDDGLDTIYLLSDGLPNAGPGIPFGLRSLTETQKTEHLSKYVRNRLKNVLNRPEPSLPRVRINAIGFFFESPDVGAFLWALAREHNGSFVGMSK